MNALSLRKWISRFWEIAGGVNIRVKIMGLVLGGTILLSLTLSIQVYRTLTTIMERDLLSQGVSIGRDLAARSTDLILLNDLFSLDQLLNETLSNNSDLRYVFILDLNGNVVANTFGDSMPLGLIALNNAAADSYQNTVQLQTPEDRVWDIAVPIFEGRAGSVRVGISDQRIQSALFDMTSQVLVTTVVVLGLSLLAATFLTLILTKPILALVEAARAVGRGDFSRRVRRWANDEIGDLSEAFNRMSHDLARGEEERAERDSLRARYVSGVIAAQEEERKRISRELHDSTSQSLTSLLIGLKELSDSCDKPEIQKRADELRGVTSLTLDEVHELALQLRPSVLDDLGLPAALTRLVSDCERRNDLDIDVALRGLDEERLPSEIETALYRIVQESLTNVVRHACAQSASVLIERRDGAVHAIIEDDGCGFDTRTAGIAEQHLGLYGIRERAELLGGTLTIESETGGGASLFIDIPLPSQEKVHA